MARLSISWLSCFGIIFVIIASFKVHHISAYNSGSGTNRTTEDSNFFTMQCSGAASVVWIRARRDFSPSETRILARLGAPARRHRYRVKFRV
ncbi:Hypothetical predicted protein [Cloeon dipterum]|uniref:Uncharacterized protein n=1 Tax=Cloeon dipterum TaxID=197152 RepID=A0A8S1E5H2_9INSE|nr:Hypothetical predicted protein [Cloeon dipterum]